MTTSPYVAAPSTPDPASPGPAGSALATSRLLLWLPVPAFVALTWLLVEGDSAISRGVADLDPLYGLAAMTIVAIGVGLGLTTMVLAAIFSFMAPGARAAGALANAAWCAFAGLGHVAVIAWATATDSVLRDSATAGAQTGWQLAAAVVALLPLAVVVATRHRPTR